MLGDKALAGPTSSISPPPGSVVQLEVINDLFSSVLLNFARAVSTHNAV